MSTRRSLRHKLSNFREDSQRKSLIFLVIVKKQTWREFPPNPDRAFKLMSARTALGATQEVSVALWDTLTPSNRREGKCFLLQSTRGNFCRAIQDLHSKESVNPLQIPYIYTSNLQSDPSQRNKYRLIKAICRNAHNTATFQTSCKMSLRHWLKDRRRDFSNTRYVERMQMPET